MESRIAETVDDATGISTKAVVDWKTQSKNTDLKPRITLRDSKGNIIKKLMIMKQDIIWCQTQFFQ